MSNKLVYHFLRFNEPPAGVNRRGATPHKVSLIQAQLHIWEGQAKSKHSKPGQIRIGKSPFSGFYHGQIFQKSLCTSLGGFGRVADVFGRQQQRSGKYTTCSVPVAPVVMSCPPLQQSRDVLATEGADCCRGVYLQYTPLLQTPDPPSPDQDCMRTLTHGECDQLKLC